MGSFTLTRVNTKQKRQAGGIGSATYDKKQKSIKEFFGGGGGGGGGDSENVEAISTAY